MKLGNTFVQVHLWIVASLPWPDDGSIVVVNFTTRRKDSDTNCLVQAGEHPWVKHETVVEYEKARIFDLATQATVMKQPSICPPHKDVSEELLARIQQGALISDLTKQKIQTIIKWSMGEQAKLKGSK
jgi:hypothetical protein